MTPITPLPPSPKTPWLSAAANLAGRELSILFRDPALVTLIFIVPPLLFTLLCLVYVKGVVRDLPVAVCDMDNSAVTRQMIRAIDASGSMSVRTYVSNIADIEAGIKSNAFAAGFYFPPNMEKDLKTGKTVSPVIFKNSQNLMIGNTIYKESVAIFRTLNGGVLLKRLTAKGLDKEKAMAAISPIAADSRILFNPYFNYGQFMCPGLIFAQLEVIIMLTALLSMAREYERQTINAAFLPGGRRGAVLWGKTVVYAAIFLLLVAAVVEILFPAFSIELKGGFFTIMLMALLFIAASFSPGLTLGLILKQPVFAMTAGILINMPAFIFGGFVFPAWAMPGIISSIAQWLPFTHFASMYFKVCLMGLPLASCGKEIGILFLFALIPVPISGLLLHAQSKKAPVHADDGEEDLP